MDVVRHTITVFQEKYLYFVDKINSMDKLFEVTFTPLSESGKPISRQVMNYKLGLRIERYDMLCSFIFIFCMHQFTNNVNMYFTHDTVLWFEIDGCIDLPTYSMKREPETSVDSETRKIKVYGCGRCGKCRYSQTTHIINSGLREYGFKNQREVIFQMKIKVYCCDRCGKCRRFMKYVSTSPPRLYCNTCDDTYDLPMKTNVKLYQELKCPLDEFELVMCTTGRKIFNYFVSSVLGHLRCYM